MKKWFQYIVCLTVAAIIFASCSKTTEEFVPDPFQPVLDTNWVTLTAPTVVDTYLQNNARSASVDSSVQNETGGLREFIGDNIRITLPRYCFIDSSAANANSRIRLEITVIRPRGELLKSLISTRSTDTLNINTAFYVLIRAFSNGNELSVRPGKKIFIECDDPAYLSNAQVYYGNIGAGTTGPNWYNVTNNVLLSVQPVNNQYRYKYYTDRTGWSSCGAVVDAGGSATQGTKIFTTLPVKFTNVNTHAYIVMHDTKTVIRMNDNVEGKYFVLPKVPASRPFRIVTISIINGVYYLGLGDATASNNLIIQLHPVESSATSINSFLNGL